MELFSQALKSLEEGANYFYQRAVVIQGNIANADTPFYRPRDLVFEQELQNQLHLKRTSPKHMDPTEPSRPFKEVVLNDVTGYDGNKVNITKELAKLAETALMTKLLDEAIKKEIGKLKLAITGR
ncbi:flagellar basal body rod protein FlgB [Thermovibrio ammonificans]